MIVLNISGYFGRNKQNSYAALTSLAVYIRDSLLNGRIRIWLSLEKCIL